MYGWSQWMTTTIYLGPVKLIWYPLLLQSYITSNRQVQQTRLTLKKYKRNKGRHQKQILFLIKSIFYQSHHTKTNHIKQSTHIHTRLKKIGFLKALLSSKIVFQEIDSKHFKSTSCCIEFTCKHLDHSRHPLFCGKWCNKAT